LHGGHDKQQFRQQQISPVHRPHQPILPGSGKRILVNHLDNQEPASQERDDEKEVHQRRQRAVAKMSQH
jgi:hypothetical protein